MDPLTILGPARGRHGSPASLLYHAWQTLLAALLGTGLLSPVALRAQDLDQPPPLSVAGQAPTGPLVTLHGVVRNAATGEALPRALVRIEGDADTGALTDGEGRFEIPNVAAGPQGVIVIKPGFRDGTASDAGEDQEESPGTVHNVLVAAEMPDVVFTMAPTNSIHGLIQLSTGDSAQGVEVTLLQRTVMSGRTVWQVASTARANSDGVYRFAGLADGMYAIYTNPAMDSEAATNLVEAGRSGNVSRSGYTSQFYADARDLAGAMKMHLAGGEQAEANLSLTLEPFQVVTATILSADGRRISDASPAQPGMAVSAVVIDGQGHQLPFAAQYDASTHMLQTSLPDGTYSILVTAITMRVGDRFAANGVFTGAQAAGNLVGQVDVSVAGHAVSNLRIPLSPIRPSPVQVSLIGSGVQGARTSPGQEGSDGVFITLNQTGGWISDGMVSSYAEGPVYGPLKVAPVQPGFYWAHTSIANKAYCEGSLTAGGANLAREPLTIGLAGPAAPVSLTLRSDCASLTLALPATMAVPVAGEEPFYTVYAVPDFDTTGDLVPQTLRASTGGTVTLEGLTPGNYHVYAFTRPVELAYHNAEAMAALGNPGQAVTLPPGGKASLVVEAPEH